MTARPGGGGGRGGGPGPRIGGPEARGGGPDRGGGPERRELKVAYSNSVEWKSKGNCDGLKNTDSLYKVSSDGIPNPDRPLHAGPPPPQVPWW